MIDIWWVGVRFWGAAGCAPLRHPGLEPGSSRRASARRQGGLQISGFKGSCAPDPARLDCCDKHRYDGRGGVAGGRPIYADPVMKVRVVPPPPAPARSSNRQDASWCIRNGTGKCRHGLGEGMWRGLSG